MLGVPSQRLHPLRLGFQAPKNVVGIGAVTAQSMLRHHRVVTAILHQAPVNMFSQESDLNVYTESHAGEMSG